MEKRIMVDLKISPNPGGSSVLVLQEKRGGRFLRIFADVEQTAAITSEKEGGILSGSAMYDHYISLATDLGATIYEIVVTEWRDQTYYARCYALSGADLHRLSAHIRIDHAVALSLRYGAPLSVNERLMNERGAVWENAKGKFVAPGTQASEPSRDAPLADPSSFAPPVAKTRPALLPPQKAMTREEQIERLKKQIAEAIAKPNENYELAAKLRDQLKALQASETPDPPAT